MTIDDESSVYVGGLPYNATEDSIRRVFDLYGAVVAVKIVNDRGTRGKCYGFVTFTNPRSAVDAIKDMNGRTIDGCVVTVNEVKTRGGKSNLTRDRFQRYDWDKGREQKWDNDRKRERYQSRHYDRSRDRSLSRHRDKERGREYAHDHVRDAAKDRFDCRDEDRYLEDKEQGNVTTRQHDKEGGRESAFDHVHDVPKDHFLSRDEDKDRFLEDNERGNVITLHQEHGDNVELEQNQYKVIGEANGYHKTIDECEDYSSRKHNEYSIDDQHTREPSSNPSDYSDQLKELERSILRREELTKEVSKMEETLDEKEQVVSDLQRRSKKLEDAVINAKKLSSHRHMQLTKLYKCFIQVKEYNERLRSCEQELQSIVDVAMTESDPGDDVVPKNVLLPSGNL